MKILFATKTHDFLLTRLTEAGYICEIKILKNSSELEKVIGDYSGIIINSRFVIEKNIIDKAVNLKFIGRVGAGMESIDLDYLNKKGIKCYNSPEGNRSAVGEHALGLLLCLLNKINIADNQVRQGKWIREENRGVEIEGKTVGIIGYGNMGSAFAKRLKGFDCNVIAYDKYKSGFSDDLVKEVTLEELLDKTDIFSIHIPLTEETKYMIDMRFLDSFKKNIYLINTARGKVLKTDDLAENLKSGKVIGAALDVMEYEDASFERMNFENMPLKLKYLLESDNVIFTPHIAGWTIESNYKHAKVLAEKILADFK
jgi:D-3-phosphoglycerate dehydrogenase